MSPDDHLRTIAADQHGLVTTDQATSVGLSRAAIRHRVRSGTLVRLAPGLYAVGGAPITEQLVLRTVHTTTALPDEHVAAPGGVRVTTPARTLFDLAPRVHHGRLERLIDRAWARRLVDGHLLHRTLNELAERGRPGIVAMRRLLADRGGTSLPRAAWRAGSASSSGMTARRPWRRRSTSEAGPGPVGWTSATAPPRVVVEVDSDLHHRSISDVRADAARDASMRAKGWDVVRVTEHELWHRPEVALRRVRAARSG